MRSLSYALAVSMLWLAASLAASAQTFKTLVNFNRTDGLQPIATLAQAVDGKLWGTTAQGGANQVGTIFRMTTTGTLNKVFNFSLALGWNPTAGLTLGVSNYFNYFYGVTDFGGTNNDGIVFKVSPTGAVTVLYNFDFTHGSVPQAPLTLGIDGNFYGTTGGGGSTVCVNGCGTIFKITPSGTLTTLYEFDSTHGAYPVGGLVQATDQAFWGTTNGGGRFNACVAGNPDCGTIFRMTPAGKLSVMHNFSGAEGANPTAGLVQGTDGNFYGTTSRGGTKDNGTVFMISPAGKLTTLWKFTGGVDGSEPVAPLVEGTDGNFYGTTGNGGSGGLGTVFQITPSGVLTTLHSFSGPDGSSPAAGLLQHTSGVFYGTNNSTVFSLDMGLGPFIKTTSNFGKVGSRVQILGTGLTGAVAVTFNGTPATTFTVNADTYMTATVPAGATSGPVQVTTPTGTLTSNVNFTIAP